MAARDRAAVTADADSADLPADDDDDFDEAEEGGNANDNMTFLETVLRVLAETQRKFVEREGKGRRK